MKVPRGVIASLSAALVIALIASVYNSGQVASQSGKPSEFPAETPTVEPADTVFFFPAIYKAPALANPTPPDNSIRRSLNAYLTWELTDSRFQGATYTIYLEADDQTPDEVVATNYGGTAFDPATFAEDTQYYWKIIADDSSGHHAESEVWTFHTDFFPDTPEVGSMVSVPAGEFLMGCDPNNSGYSCLTNQVPLHAVLLDAFEIDKYEVTNSEYRACTDAGACNLPRKFISHIDEPYFYNPDYDYFPVMYVSHWDAEDYCAWVGKRLPTEAEWEKAARGAMDTRPWPWGNEHWDCDRVNRCGEWHSARVDSFHTNQSPYGAVNMAGNVFEWVQDHYYDYYYGISPYENPVNTEQLQNETIPFFSIRGGSYHDNWWYARINHRSGGHHGDKPGGDSPLFRSFRVGFRCARSVVE